jgi:hypothetical protein
VSEEAARIDSEGIRIMLVKKILMQCSEFLSRNGLPNLNQPKSSLDIKCGSGLTFCLYLAELVIGVLVTKQRGVHDVEKAVRAEEIIEKLPETEILQACEELVVAGGFSSFPCSIEQMR